MKRTLLIFAVSFLCIASADAQLRIGGRKIDTGKAVKAVGDMATAVTPLGRGYRRLVPRVCRMDGRP